MSEPHGMVFDFEAVKMAESVEQNKSEIEEIGNAAPCSTNKTTRGYTG